MSGKDVTASPSQLWKQRVSMMLAGAALAVGAIAVRHFLGPADTSAQAPVRRAPQVRRAAAPQQPAGKARQGVVPTSAAQPGGTIKTMQTMAMVNGQPISRDSLAQAVLARFGEPVLESLVNKHLIWQACQQKGIRISEQDVEDEIERVAAKFGFSVDRWLELLRDERDITPAKYRREIIWPTLALRRLAASDLQVSQQELQQAMETEFGAKVKARMIIVKDQQKASQLLAAVRQAPDKFSQYAKQHSEDPNSASAGGLIPPIARHVGDKLLEEAAFKLKQGEVSAVVPVAGQYVILKCEEILPESYVPSQNIAAVKQRLTDEIRDRKLREAAGGLFQRLQSQAKVVNVFNNPQLRAQQPTVAATINGAPITIEQLSLECLERHGLEVLEGEINRAILNQELARRNLSVTQQALDAEVARAADSFGYLKDGKPDVPGWLEAVTESEGVSQQIYVQDAVWPSAALKRLVRQRVEVTDEDLQKGFASNYGERVEVQAIVFANQRQAQQVWAQAKAENTQQFFGQLAGQYSIEPVSRANSGRVPPIRRHSGHQKLEEEAFRLQPGELSIIVATGDKYVVMRCLGRTEPVDVKLAEVRSDLYKDLLERKLRVEMAKEFDRLHEAARVENYLAELTKPAAAAAATAARPLGPAARR